MDDVTVDGTGACCARMAVGVDADGKDKNLKRLRRIEGQVRGLQRMVESERYCVDILTQMRAVHAALREVERRILKVHLETCVHRAFTLGSPEERKQKIAEVLSVFDWERGRAAR